jgi:hypothetical protein
MAILAITAFAPAGTGGTVASSDHHRVLIELFTSQG